MCAGRSLAPNPNPRGNLSLAGLPARPQPCADRAALCLCSLRFVLSTTELSQPGAPGQVKELWEISASFTFQRKPQEFGARRVEPRYPEQRQRGERER